MSKRKHNQRKQRRGPPANRQLSSLGDVRRQQDRLAQAERMGQRGDWEGARDLLLELDRRRPGQLSVLSLLSQACLELQDRDACEAVCRRAVKANPNQPDAHLMLAGAQLSNFHPALARRTFRGFLRQWPDDPRSADVRKTLAEIETALEQSLIRVDFPTDDPFDLAASNEEVLAYLAQGQFAAARDAAERLLQSYPRFLPAWNNLSEAQFRLGQGEQAIASARRALEIEPENCHALGNLTRYLCLWGRMDEAREAAQRLKRIESNRADLPVKQAEALSLLGDDEGVCQVFQRHSEAAHELLPKDNALLHHLAAVASARLGRGTDAVRLWNESLRLQPHFALAQENLADHRRPVGKRHGPWAFEITHWVPHGTFRALFERVGPAAGRLAKQSATQETRRFLDQHPEVARLLPLLFERGSPDAAAFAVKLAAIVKTPETLEPLRTFAFGQRGSDKLRLEAVQVLMDAEVIPPGEVRLWAQGEWRDVVLTSFELSDEPVGRHTPRVQRLVEESHEFLMRGDFRRAKPLLEEALAIEPDSPVILNNLISALQLEGRKHEVEQMICDLHQRFPNYFFGRVNMANICIQRREYERARELLAPLLRQRRLHVSEFSALCMSHIQLFLAQGKRDGARTWLQMWERGSPDDPRLPEWRGRIERSRWSIFGKFFR
ncbi:MAG: tetratricopeptide repeat protein [Planctomycetes bacterium]|nr:tetratricopeptide repeat protein [Planctomycetota bacterium]